MWVRREEWQRMKERVSDLESWKRQQEFTVYKSYPSHLAFSYPSIQSQTVSPQNVIYRILKHLGLKLEYVEGTPTTVTLAKVPQPVAASYRSQEDK